MKTTILKILASIFLVAAISACGDDSPKPEKENENENGNGNGNSSILADNDIYFIIVDGIRYDTKTTFQKILDDGYTILDSYMNKTCAAGKSSMDGVGFRWDNNTRFLINPINKTNKDLKYTECTIYRIQSDDGNYDNITIYGNLTFGSTIAEVEKVFEGEIFTKMTREEREESWGDAIMPNSIKRIDVSITFTKSRGASDGNFQFSFDDDGKLIRFVMVSNR